MKKPLALLVAVTALSLIHTAHAADASADSQTNVQQKANGGYETTTTDEQNGADGSKTTNDKKVDLTVGSDGKTTKTIKKQSTTSKGALHKSTDKSTSEYKDKDNGGFKKTKTVTHTNTDGTNVKEKASTNVNVDSKGNVISTEKSEKTTDPQGLMNSTTTTSTTKSVNGAIVDQETNTK